MRERQSFLEFDCPGCGQHVVASCSDPRVQPRCHRCRTMPGWHLRPEIVAGFEVDRALIAADEAAPVEGSPA